MNDSHPEAQQNGRSTTEPLVLIQNDCESAAEMLRFYVESDFHLSTVATSNPMKVLEIMARTPPVLIITDLNHPHLSGEQFIRWAKRVCPAVPILVVTGDSILRQKRAIQTGAAAAIGLPCAAQKLVAAIAGLLPTRGPDGLAVKIDPPSRSSQTVGTIVPLFCALLLTVGCASTTVRVHGTYDQIWDVASSRPAGSPALAATTWSVPATDDALRPDRSRGIIPVTTSKGFTSGIGKIVIRPVGSTNAVEHRVSVSVRENIWVFSFFGHFYPNRAMASDIANSIRDRVAALEVLPPPAKDTFINPKPVRPE